MCRDEIALLHIFDYVVYLLEMHTKGHLTSAVYFALTFVSLATTIPAIFRFAPIRRLASLLQQMGAYDLFLCVILSQQQQQQLEEEEKEEKESSSSPSSFGETAFVVAHDLLQAKDFGKAKALHL